MRVIVALLVSLIVAGLAVAAAVDLGSGERGQPTHTPQPAPTTAPAPAPRDGRVPAEVVDFIPGYGGAGRVAVMGGTPVDPDDPTRPGDQPGTPGITYVAVTGLTGCRLPAHAELWRTGDTVYARFTGGVDHQECVRATTPFAQFAVDARRLRGVRAVSRA